jgi:hypothetical protein
MASSLTNAEADMSRHSSAGDAARHLDEVLRYLFKLALQLAER